MTKSTTLKTGDAVEWDVSQAKVRGRVKRKLTENVDIKGHHASTSPEEPQYLVQRDKTGAQAAHKADALKKQR